MCCALVFAMVVIGGVTRLTHSGLSITEWQPIVGTLPPLTDADWQSAFAKYQATPEYQQVNKGMELSEFKGIFWWEYFHRLLGRLIGVAFFVPYLWFLARRQIPPGYGWRLARHLRAGRAAGRDGLVHGARAGSSTIRGCRSFVSPRTSASRSSSSRRCCGSPGRCACRGGSPSRDDRQRGVRRFAFALVAVVFAMVLTGGVVAGIRAGFAYNTFPLMNGAVVPPEILSLTPWWKNFFWNMATVQFDHRLLAWALAFAVPALWWRARGTPGLPSRARAGTAALLAMLAVQVGLGIATLVNVVPLPLARVAPGRRAAGLRVRVERRPRAALARRRRDAAALLAPRQAALAVAAGH